MLCAPMAFVVGDSGASHERGACVARENKAGHNASHHGRVRRERPPVCAGPLRTGVMSRRAVQRASLY